MVKKEKKNPSRWPFHAASFYKDLLLIISLQYLGWPGGRGSGGDVAAALPVSHFCATFPFTFSKFTRSKSLRKKRLCFSYTSWVCTYNLTRRLTPPAGESVQGYIRVRRVLPYTRRQFKTNLKLKMHEANVERRLCNALHLSVFVCLFECALHITWLNHMPLLQNLKCASVWGGKKKQKKTINQND